MRAYFPFLLFIFISLAAKGQGNDSLAYLLYNPETCPACRAYIQQAGTRLHQKLTVVVKESYANFKEIVEEGVGNSPTVQIVYSDSLYELLQRDQTLQGGGTPVLLLYNKQMKLLAQQKMSNLPAETKAQSARLPAQLKLPDNTMLDADSRDWVLLSNIGSYSVIQWASKTDTADIGQFKFYDSLQTLGLMQALTAANPAVKTDYDLYKSWGKRIQKLFPGFLGCEALRVHHDTVWALLNVLAFKKAGYDKYDQDRRVFMLKFYQRRLCAVMPVQDIQNRKRGYLHTHNNFFIAQTNKIYFNSFVLSDKYKAYPLVMEYKQAGNAYRFVQYKPYKLNKAFKQILFENMNIGNYYLGNEVLYYAYLNEIYDVGLNKTIQLGTAYPYVDSLALGRTGKQCPVWQFNCSKYMNAYYSFVMLEGNYYLLKYNHEGKELWKRKMDMDFDMHNEPKVCYQQGQLLILNLKRKEITTLVLD